MKTPRGLDARRFIRALAEAGFSESRIEGSHHRYKQSDAFPIGTLKRMLEATRWTEADLRRLGLIDF